MGFGIEKCTMLIIKNSKRHIREGLELPSQDKIRTLGEKKLINNCEYVKQTTTNNYKLKKKITKSISGGRER